MSRNVRVISIKILECSDNRANIELLLTGNYTIYTTIKYTVPAEYGEIELAPVISLLPKLRSFGLRLPLADKL